MFTHYRTEGVILRIRQTREADEIFTIYTRDFGKIDIVGRSIRKNTSKLRMNMSLFSHVEVGFIQGKNCNTLTDVVSISNFSRAKEMLGKLALLYRISETLLTLIYGQEKDEKVFSFLVQSFQKISETDLSKNRLELFFCFFSFNLLYFLGHKMYIEKCALCGGAVTSGCYFSPKEGGVVCKSCFGREPVGVYLQDVNSLRCFYGNDLSQVFSQNPQKFLNILENYLAFVPEAQK